MNYFANPYQGYGSPYGYPSAAPQNAAGAPQAFGGQVTRVNGRNGADAFRMAPNSSILLMDENDPIVWLKQTDGAGYATDTLHGDAVSGSGPGGRGRTGKPCEKIGGDAEWQTR